MKKLVLVKIRSYTNSNKRKNFYFFLAKETSKMRKHTREELKLFVEELTMGKINLKERIKYFSKDERKYIEKKCKYYNLQDVNKLKPEL